MDHMMRIDERDDGYNDGVMTFTVGYVRVRDAIQVSRHTVGGGLFEWLIDFTQGADGLAVRVLTNPRQLINLAELAAVFSVWDSARPATLTELELLLRDSDIPESFEMDPVDPDDYAREAAERW